MDDNRITYFAEADYRNSKTKFGIKAKDRTRHFYAIGKTGMGKSTVLENMAIQDIQNGEGLAFIDPHGGTAEKLLDYVPEDRIKDVIYFAPFDTDYPISFNIMEDVGADKRHLVASGLMSAFKKIWADAWSARMEYILSNTLLALLEYPDATLLGVNRMLSDKEYRKKVVENIADPSVKSFWVDEFAKYTERFAAEATPAIQNKVGQFTSNPLIRNIIGQPKSSFDIRKIMDEKKILIMNLSKGLVGEQNAKLLGSMLVTKIYLAAMSRADLSAGELRDRPNFNFYIDEFQTFANETFAEILSEARKYKLNLSIAHQYVEQMPEEVRAAVFGNVGTMVVFRVGSFDAEIFEKEFAPQFTADDIVNLGQYQMYLRLMIDQVGSKPFSAVGMAPIPAPEKSYKSEIIEYSRSHNARTRKMVEEEIHAWHAPIIPERKAERMKMFGQPDGAGTEMRPRSQPERPRYQPQNERREQGYDRPTRMSPITPHADTPIPRPTPRPMDVRTAPPAKPMVHRAPQPFAPEIPKTAQTAPVVKSPENTETKPFLKQGNKSTLKDILKKLESEESSDNKPQAPASIQNIPTQVEVKKVEPISLSSLGGKDRSASKNKLSELKSALEQFNKDAQKKVADNAKNESVTPAKKDTISSKSTNKKTKEIPEDVLRGMLKEE